MWARSSSWWSCTRFIRQCKWDESKLTCTIWEVWAQYDQQLVNLGYGCDSLQDRLALCDSRSEASYEPSCVAYEPFEAYWWAFVSSHRHLKSYLASGLGECLMEGELFVSETVDVHRTCTVELISSALDALELDPHSTIEVLRSAERSGTVSSTNLDPLPCVPDLLSQPFSFLINLTSSVGILLTIFSSFLTFPLFAELLKALRRLFPLRVQYRTMKCCRMCSAGFTVSSCGSYSNQLTT